MSYLIVRIEPMENEGVPEGERKPIIRQLSIKVRKDRDGVTMSAVGALMSRNGFELGPVVGKRVASDWPLTAYVYTSDNREGIGRSGSSFYRWPAKKAAGIAQPRHYSEPPRMPW